MMLVKQIYQETILQMLIDEFNLYFPEYTEEVEVDQKLIRNPPGTGPGEVTDATMLLIRIQSFWCIKAISYISHREMLCAIFRVFPTTYLCE